MGISTNNVMESIPSDDPIIIGVSNEDSLIPTSIDIVVGDRGAVAVCAVIGANGSAGASEGKMGNRHVIRTLEIEDKIGAIDIIAVEDCARAGRRPFNANSAVFGE